MAKASAKSKVAPKAAKAKAPAKAAKVAKTKQATVAKTKQIKRTAPNKTSKKDNKIPAKSARVPKPKAPAGRKTKPALAKPAKVPAKSALKSASQPVAKVAKKAGGADSGPKGYTADQYKKYKEEVVKLQKQSNASLKQMLKKNLQSMSGNKDEMIAKIADGIVLGRIPRCPSCFGGRPKFDFKKGTYSCPGYRDDTDFKNCHKTFSLDEIKRDPWE